MPIKRNKKKYRLDIEYLPLDDNLQELLIYAMRYTLGRQSYAPASVWYHVTPMLSHLSDNTLLVMHRDIIYEIEMYERMGKEIAYKKYWNEFARQIKAEQEKRKFTQKTDYEQLPFSD